MPLSSSHSCLLLFFLCSLHYIYVSSNATNSYMLQIQKDKTKLQYYTSLKLGTSPKHTTFVATTVVDLGGDLTWFDCARSRFNSSTYRPVPCASAKCKAAKGTRCSARYNTTCGLYPYNPVANAVVATSLAEDRLSAMRTTDKRQAYVSKFPLTCVSSAFLKGLSNRTKGVVGLSRAYTALPAQFSLALNVSRKLALCLPSSTDRGSGAVIIGGGPYTLPSFGKDGASLLKTTPLIINNVSTTPVSPEGEPSDEYFIGVKSIKVDGKTVTSLDGRLLEINKTSGVGGTKLSTVEPYTTMQTSIYKAVVSAFVKAAAARKMKRVSSVKPFGACYSVRSVGASKTGHAVPNIDLVMQSKSVYWRIYGANSMVRVSRSVTCLGFTDGGKERRTAVVIGGLQMEDNLVELDLENNRLGFSSTLLANNSTCSHYGFSA